MPALVVSPMQERLSSLAYSSQCSVSSFRACSSSFMQEASVSPTPPVSAISALQLFSTSNFGTTSARAVSGAFASAAARDRTNIDARIFSHDLVRDRRGEIGIDEDLG